MKNYYVIIAFLVLFIGIEASPVMALSGNKFEKRADIGTIVGNNADRVTITGRVLDSMGQPVAGCSVVIKGTTTGTITDLDGYFTIEAEIGDTLVFSIIGFTSQEVLITSSTVINITLAFDE